MEASTWKKIFLLINCIILGIGNTAGPLIMRLYFIKGGKRVWLSSFLQTAGFPIILIPLTINYIRRGTTMKLYFMNLRVLLSALVIGVLIGASNYFYSYGISMLPVSTSSILLATNLAFTAVFAYFIVKQKFTAYSVNAIVLLTVGAAVLGLNASGDRPEGVTSKQYAMGFVLTVLAAGTAGLALPSVELTYMKSKILAISYTLVLEFQMVMCFSATVFCIIGMLINNDFQAISKEAKQFELGEGKYYLVLVWSAIILQCFFLGIIGVVYYASSLLSGIIIAVTLPITEVLAVIFYHEKFKSEKGVALFLSLWGFVSYLVGEMKHDEKKKNIVDTPHDTETVQMTNQVVLDVEP